MPLKITSTAFKEGDDLPVQLTCDGADQSPPLTWTGVPMEAQSLALMMEDPDAPNGTFTHWILYNIPRDIDGLPQGVENKEDLGQGIRQCTNSFGNLGYGGPCPPSGHGSHRYFFRVYALDSPILLNEGAKREDFLNAIEGHILDEGHLMGRYERAQAKATEAL